VRRYTRHIIYASHELRKMRTRFLLHFCTSPLWSMRMLLGSKSSTQRKNTPGLRQKQYSRCHRGRHAAGRMPLAASMTDAFRQVMAASRTKVRSTQPSVMRCEVSCSLWCRGRPMMSLNDSAAGARTASAKRWAHGRSRTGLYIVPARFADGKAACAR
jgi:hypothetical protein